MSPRQVAFGNVSGFLAFGFGSGLSPIAPGTAGSLTALVPALILPWLPVWAGLLWVAVAFALGVVICDRASRALGVHDHGGIVWDEFVGLWLVLTLVPFDWAWWLAALVAFRVFDIVKPWPIGWLDKRVAGGFGVMIDDLIAALYAWAALAIAGVWIG